VAAGALPDVAGGDDATAAELRRLATAAAAAAAGRGQGCCCCWGSSRRGEGQGEAGEAGVGGSPAARMVPRTMYTLLKTYTISSTLAVSICFGPSRQQDPRQQGSASCFIMSSNELLHYVCSASCTETESIRSPTARCLLSASSCCSGDRWRLFIQGRCELMRDGLCGQQFAPLEPDLLHPRTSHRSKYRTAHRSKLSSGSQHGDC